MPGLAVVLSVVIALTVFIRAVRDIVSLRFMSPSSFLQPLDPLQRILREQNKHGDSIFVNAIFLKCSQQLTLKHVGKVVLHLMEMYPLLKSCVYQPNRNKHHTYMLDIESCELGRFIGTQNETQTWKVGFEDELLHLPNEKTGPLWKLIFIPSVTDNNYTLFASSNGVSDCRLCSGMHELGVPKSNKSSEKLYKCAVILNFYHPAFDGISSVRVIGDFLDIADKVLCDEYLPKPDPCVISKSTLFQRTTWTETFKMWKQLLSQHVKYQLYGYQPVACNFIRRMGTESCRQTRVIKRTRIVPVEWNKELTKKILKKCRQYKCTAQGAFQTAVGIALSSIMSKGESAYTPVLAMDVHVNIRPHIEEILPDDVGLYISTITIFQSYTAVTNTADFWKQAVRTSRCIHETIKKKEQLEKMRVTLGLEGLVDMRMKHSDLIRKDEYHAGRKPVDISFSNLGNCPNLGTPRKHIRMNGNFFATSGHNLGSCFSVKTITFDDRMFWTFTYYENVVRQEIAEKWVCQTVDCLAKAVDFDTYEKDLGQDLSWSAYIRI